MVQRDFIPYEQSLKLKELGFDEPCLGKFYYNHLEIGGNWRNDDFKEDPDIFISAPLYQQVFRWFRNKYGIDFSINTIYSRYNENTSKKYSGVIDTKTMYTNVGFYDTYEEAELECLNKLIEIAKL
jgi:hypothetical protein